LVLCGLGDLSARTILSVEVGVIGEVRRGMGETVAAEWGGFMKELVVVLGLDIESRGDWTRSVGVIERLELAELIE